MNDKIYVSESQLHEHLADIREILRMVNELSDSIRQLKYFDSLVGDDRCRRLEKEAIELERMLENLLGTMNDFCRQIEMLIETSKRTLVEAKDDIHHMLKYSMNALSERD